MIKHSTSFANEESFKYYVMFLAMKKHFGSQYDYHKYHGKIKASFDKFRTSQYAYFFEKLSHKEDPENLILANMIVKPDVWIREILDDEGEERYLQWKIKMNSMSRIFKADLEKLDDNYQANFAVHNGQHPYVMTLYSQKQISLETFTVLTHMANIFGYWEQNIVDKIIASDIIKLSKKYKPFLNLNEKKLKDLVRNRFF